MMTNINYEIKALEQIQVEIAEAVFRQIKGAVIEASEQQFSNRWEDIVNAVLQANPAPAAVSSDKLIKDLEVQLLLQKDMVAYLTDEDKRLNTRVEDLQAELNVLRAENFQLQAALLGASCKLPDCPVKAQEEAGEVNIEEHVQKAVELANEVKMPSMMDELNDPTSEIEDSFWDNDDSLLGGGDDLLLVDDGDASFELEEDNLLSGAPLTEEDGEDPFAVAEDKVLDILSGNEEFDPFSTDVADDSDIELDTSDIHVSEFSDDDVPPVTEFEEEEEQQSSPESEPAKSPIPSKSPIIPSSPDVAPLKKGEVRVITYKVFDKEVGFVQSNAYINGVKNKLVKDMAFQLHNVMLQQNEDYKTFTPAEREEGKFYTQMIREWGLEIAAANNIERVKGDDGCAILIAELFYSMHTEKQNLISPILRSRNEEEKKAAEKLFHQLEANKKVVDDHTAALALDPMMFVGTKKLDKANTLKAGYALLRARMELTWNNATGKKTECVFPIVKKVNMKKGEV